MTQPHAEPRRAQPDAETLPRPSTPPAFAPTGSDRELVLLTNDSMRARRAPFAILWLWGFQTVLAALAAWPFLSTVGNTYGSHPRGDAPVWRAGGLALIDLLEANVSHLPSLTPLPMLALAAAVVLGLLPLALLLGQMTYATRSRGAAGFVQLMPKALTAFGPLVIVYACVLVIQGALLGLGFAFGGATSQALADRLGEARAAQVGGLVTLVFAIATSLVGVLQDLARAAIVRFQVGALKSARLALNTFRRGPVLVYWAWAWRALAMALLVILGSAVAEKSSIATGAWLPLLALHQTVVIGRLTLRASWLAKALRAVDFAHRVVRKGTSGSSSGARASSAPPPPPSSRPTPSRPPPPLPPKPPSLI